MIGVRLTSLGFESAPPAHSCVDLEWVYGTGRHRMWVRYKALDPEQYRIYAANTPDETPVCIAQFAEHEEDEMFAFIETVQEVL